MTSGPRNYTSGTRAALFAFSQRTCYYPDCDIPVVRFVGDDPVINVDIAHISGALPGAPRYDESMTDDERRGYANLILLCIPHHKTVDRLHPEKYSVDELGRWKREHEDAIGTASLEGITEDRLAQLIEEAVRAAGVKRHVELEIAPGISMPTGVFPIPGDQPGAFFDFYRDIGVPALLLTARNPGPIDVVVNSHGIRLLPANTTIQLPYTPYQNLPALLRPGHSLTWAYPVSALHLPVLTLENRGYTITHLRSEVTLATGENVISDEITLLSLGRLDRVPWSRQE